ncbi:MAG: cell division protein ZapA [Prevotella sp.]|jgi:cell division protein ZapA|nr:cell division protein ZapA [Prevotella sp.]MCI2080016.1 cell division protein ZapA [Prevotella sp.]MCI2101818.1 cell division protein ZapA [Prevotella sp.]
MAEGNRDKLHIRLHVYDRDISVIIPREEEEYYRNAAKLITDTVNTYAQVYKGMKSDIDLLYMALIDISLRFVKESKRNDTAPYCDILSKLTSEIEEVLKA